MEKCSEEESDYEPIEDDSSDYSSYRPIESSSEDDLSDDEKQSQDTAENSADDRFTFMQLDAKNQISHLLQSQSIINCVNLEGRSPDKRNPVISPTQVNISADKNLSADICNAPNKLSFDTSEDVPKSDENIKIAKSAGYSEYSNEGSDSSSERNIDINQLNDVVIIDADEILTGEMEQSSGDETPFSPSAIFPVNKSESEKKIMVSKWLNNNKLVLSKSRDLYKKDLNLKGDKHGSNEILVNRNMFEMVMKTLQKCKITTPIKADAKAMKCGLCKMNFKSKAEAIKHMDYHTDHNRQRNCGFCPEVFANRESLRKHIQSKHKLKDNNLSSKFNCQICNTAFKTITALRRHTSQNHKDRGLHQCGRCGKEFVGWQKFLVHEKMCKGNKKFTCLVCSIDFSTNSNFKTHITSKHGIKVSEKNVQINEVTSSTTQLENIENIYKFRCNLCRVNFNNNALVIAHIDKAHDKAISKKTSPEKTCPKAIKPTQKKSNEMKSIKKKSKKLNEEPVEKSVAIEQKVTVKGNGSEKNEISNETLQENNSVINCKICSQSLNSTNDIWNHVIEHLNMQDNFTDIANASESPNNVDLFRLKCKKLAGLEESSSTVSTGKPSVSCIFCFKIMEYDKLNEHTSKHIENMNNAQPKEKTLTHTKSMNNAPKEQITENIAKMPVPNEQTSPSKEHISTHTESIAKEQNLTSIEDITKAQVPKEQISPSSQDSLFERHVSQQFISECDDGKNFLTENTDLSSLVQILTGGDMNQGNQQINIVPVALTKDNIHVVDQSSSTYLPNNNNISGDQKNMQTVKCDQGQLYTQIDEDDRNLFDFFDSIANKDSDMETNNNAAANMNTFSNNAVGSTSEIDFKMTQTIPSTSFINWFGTDLNQTAHNPMSLEHQFIYTEARTACGDNLTNANTQAITPVTLESGSVWNQSVVSIAVPKLSSNISEADSRHIESLQQNGSFSNVAATTTVYNKQLDLQCEEVVKPSVGHSPTSQQDLFVTSSIVHPSKRFSGAVKTTHKSKCFTCQMCGFSKANSLELFYKHIEYHPKDRYKCLLSEVETEFSDYINLHVYGTENETMCKLCNLSITDANNELQRHHQKQHKVLFSCSVCGNRYWTKKHFQIHAREHMKFEKCSECSATFSCKANLKKHINVAHTIRQYECPNCEYSSLPKLGPCQKNHSCTYTLRPGVLRCDKCRFGTTREQVMKNHKLVHNDCTAALCPFCNVLFRRRSFQAHIDKFHPNENVNPNHHEVIEESSANSADETVNAIEQLRTDDDALFDNLALLADNAVDMLDSFNANDSLSTLEKDKSANTSLQLDEATTPSENVEQLQTNDTIQQINNHCSNQLPNDGDVCHLPGQEPTNEDFNPAGKEANNNHTGHVVAETNYFTLAECSSTDKQAIEATDNCVLKDTTNDLEKVDIANSSLQLDATNETTAPSENVEQLQTNDSIQLHQSPNHCSIQLSEDEAASQFLEQLNEDLNLAGRDGNKTLFQPSDQFENQEALTLASKEVRSGEKTIVDEENYLMLKNSTTFTETAQQQDENAFEEANLEFGAEEDSVLLTVTSPKRITSEGFDIDTGGQSNNNPENDLPGHTGESTPSLEETDVLKESSEKNLVPEETHMLEEKSVLGDFSEKSLYPETTPTLEEENVSRKEYSDKKLDAAEETHTLEEENNVLERCSETSSDPKKPDDEIIETASGEKVPDCGSDESAVKGAKENVECSSTDKQAIEVVADDCVLKDTTNDLEKVDITNGSLQLDATNETTAPSENVEQLQTNDSIQLHQSPNHCSIQLSEDEAASQFLEQFNEDLNLAGRDGNKTLFQPSDQIENQEALTLASKEVRSGEKTIVDEENYLMLKNSTTFTETAQQQDENAFEEANLEFRAEEDSVLLTVTSPKRITSEGFDIDTGGQSNNNPEKDIPGHTRESTPSLEETDVLKESSEKNVVPEEKAVLGHFSEKSLYPETTPTLEEENASRKEYSDKKLDAAEETHTLEEENNVLEKCSETSSDPKKPDDEIIETASGEKVPECGSDESAVKGAKENVECSSTDKQAIEVVADDCVLKDTTNAEESLRENEMKSKKFFPVLGPRKLKKVWKKKVESSPSTDESSPVRKSARPKKATVRLIESEYDEGPANSESKDDKSNKKLEAKKTNNNKNATEVQPDKTTRRDLRKRAANASALHNNSMSPPKPTRISAGPIPDSSAGESLDILSPSQRLRIRMFKSLRNSSQKTSEEQNNDPDKKPPIVDFETSIKGSPDVVRVDWKSENTDKSPDSADVKHQTATLAGNSTKTFTPIKRAKTRSSRKAIKIALKCSTPKRSTNAQQSTKRIVQKAKKQKLLKTPVKNSHTFTRLRLKDEAVNKESKENVREKSTRRLRIKEAEIEELLSLKQITRADQTALSCSIIQPFKTVKQPIRIARINLTHIACYNILPYGQNAMAINEQMFKCNFCTYKTLRKCNLTRHIKRSHTANSITCSRCAFTCNSQAALNLHSKRKHTGEKNPLKRQLDETVACTFTSPTSEPQAKRRKDTTKSSGAEDKDVVTSSNMTSSMNLVEVVVTVRKLSSVEISFIRQNLASS